jgi:hypothetical protein
MAILDRYSFFSVLLTLGFCWLSKRGAAKSQANPYSRFPASSNRYPADCYM